jgi:hypothetical protein
VINRKESPLKSSAHEHRDAFDVAMLDVANSPRKIFCVTFLLAHAIMKTYCGVIAVKQKEPGHG